MTLEKPLTIDYSQPDEPPTLAPRTRIHSSHIERRCEGLNRKDSINPRYFKKLPDGKYGLAEVALQ